MRAVLRLPVVLAAVLLASCSPPRVAVVAPDHAGIDLHLRVVTEAGPRARADCEAGIAGVLLHHGFVLGPGGSRVDMEAWVMRDFPAGVPTFAVDVAQASAYTPQIPRPSADPDLTTDLTARVYGPGPSPRVLLASATAQRQSCAAAAERFAGALVDAVGAPLGEAR
jgi:hypothetical protein